MAEHTIVKELPESERPYEKFLNGGAGRLSDAELLAIILKTGTKEQNALEIARNILQNGQGNLLNLYDFSYETLLGFPGLGKVKAIQLKAVAELSRRIAKTNSGYQVRMSSPDSIADYYMEEMRHEKQEIVVCAFFDAKCRFLGDMRISAGSTNFAYLSPKDVMRSALEKNAVQFILLHNHPSGDPEPSGDDIRMTNQMSECGRMLDIRLADHIIIGDNRYFSFQANSLIRT